MLFDFEPYRSLLTLCQELGQESQLRTAGPALIGSPLPAIPMQARHLTPLPRQFFFLLCVFSMFLVSTPTPATFVDQDQFPPTDRR